MASGTTFNLSTQNSNTHQCLTDGGDAIAYAVTTLTDGHAVVDRTPVQGCLNVNDEVMVINLRGSSTSTVNVGNYEFLRVASVSGSTVNFTSQKLKHYGSGLTDDANIGTGSGQQRVMLQRVPNYNNVTINGTITTNGWDGTKSGVVAFRVAGTLSGSGMINAATIGYAGGGSGSPAGMQGESYGGIGTYSTAANLGGGGAGYVTGSGGIGILSHALQQGCLSGSKLFKQN